MIKFTGCKIHKFRKKKALVLEAQYQHQIVFTHAIFYYTVCNSLLLFASLTQCALTHSWAVIVCIASIIFNVGSWGDDLEKKRKIKQNKDLRLNFSGYMDFLPQF